MTYILGLTGGIGCGKTAATDQFARHGIPIVDADILAREQVALNTPALAAIAEHFGPSILFDSGELDRKKLRDIIFNRPQEKAWLEALLHPKIRQGLIAALQQPSTAAYSILSAPLLLEGDLYTLVDRILVIDCDPTLQVARTQQRDQCDPSTLKKIIAQQISREQRLAKADDIISNNGSIADLQQAVDQYHQQLQDSLTNTTATQ